MKRTLCTKVFFGMLLMLLVTGLVLLTGSYVIAEECHEEHGKADEISADQDQKDQGQNESTQEVQKQDDQSQDEKTQEVQEQDDQSQDEKTQEVQEQDDQSSADQTQDTPKVQRPIKWKNVKNNPFLPRKYVKMVFEQGKKPLVKEVVESNVTEEEVAKYLQLSKEKGMFEKGTQEKQEKNREMEDLLYLIRERLTPLIEDVLNN